MATHPHILAWRIPRTEESGGLQSMGSQSDTTERLSTPGSTVPDLEFLAVGVITNNGLCLLCRRISLM